MPNALQYLTPPNQNQLYLILNNAGYNQPDQTNALGLSQYQGRPLMVVREDQFPGQGVNALNQYPGFAPGQLETNALRAMDLGGNISTSMMPVMGDVRDMGEALGGRDWWTGQQLTGPERWMSAGAAAIPFLGGSILRKSKNILFHGSPHTWEAEDLYPNGRPLLNKIGSGEGAAVYGWGWYSAEKDKTARSYLKTGATALGKDVLFYNGKPYNRDPENILKQIVTLSKDPIGHLQKEYDYWKTEDIEHAQNIKQWIEDINNGSLELKKITPDLNLGKLYKIEIPESTQNKLLNWDKPLINQNNYIKKAIRPILKEDNGEWLTWKSTGKDLYKYLSFKLNGGISPNQEMASEYLSSVGIPGQYYLDQGSRNIGAGTHNFVLWDQEELNKLKILEIK